MSDEHETPDVVAHAFDALEAEVDDAGFATAVQSRLTVRLRLRRWTLIAVSALGLAPLLFQLNAAGQMFANIPAPVIDAGAPAQAALDVDWLATGVLFLVVPAVLLGTGFAIASALRARAA